MVCTMLPEIDRAYLTEVDAHQRLEQTHFAIAEERSAQARAALIDPEEAALRQTLHAAEADLARANIKRAQLDERIAAGQRHASEQEVFIVTKKQTNEDLQKKIRDLRKALTSSSTERDEAESELDRVSSHKKRAHHHCVDLQKIIDQFDRDIKGKRNEILALNKELGDDENKSELQKQVEEAQAELTTLKTTQAIREREVRLQIEKLLQRNSQLQMNQKSTKIDITEAAESVEHMELKLENATAENQKLSGHIIPLLETELKELNLKADILREKLRKAQLESKLRVWASNEPNESDFGGKKISATTMSSKMQRQAAELNHLHRRIKELQDEVHIKEEATQHALANSKFLDVILDRVKAETDDHHEQFENLSAEHGRVKTRLEVSPTDNIAFNALLSNPHPSRICNSRLTGSKNEAGGRVVDSGRYPQTVRTDC